MRPRSIFALLNLLVASKRQGLRSEIPLNQWMESGQKTSAKYQGKLERNIWTRLGIASGVVAALAAEGPVLCLSAMKLPQLR